jgi:hypothetical protein
MAAAIPSSAEFFAAVPAFAIAADAARARRPMSAINCGNGAARSERAVSEAAFIAKGRHGVEAAAEVEQ